jgi:hypothetical protein
MDEQQPSPAERLNMVCFEVSRELDGLEPVVPQAAPLARTLLRVVGRVLIDTAAPGAEAADWPNTEAMALQWIDEALRPLGYQVRPTPEGGREELRPPSADW